ncbi:APH(3')-I family aminoglycoside O-phosphotransferase [Pseudoduganella sp.]|uniref:APH(3')-I family aminoglycoside O-phosphotransferase n=1 Tax=Pseudoduganella sp. TaxID=1880898 RepID=UPI0035AFE8CA
MQMSDGGNAGMAAPENMAAVLAAYEWRRNTVGQSGGAVYRLHGKAGAPDLFLKSGKGLVADDITDEMARLCWLSAYLPVPALVQFTRTADEAWLLMTAMPGETAYQILAHSPEQRSAVVAAIARFLRRIHAIPTSACPFTSNHEYRLARAQERLNAGLVDEEDFDDERQGWSAVQVWDALQALLPLASDPVVTHGDYSLDNILIKDGEVVACIDVGRVGIADRYQDIAIAWNSLGEFGASLQEEFLQQYDVPSFDREKLDFHLMLDEFF